MTIEQTIVAFDENKMNVTQFSRLDNWYEENLVCPVDHSELQFDAPWLISKCSRRYPVVEGVPIMLDNDENQTIELASATIKRAHGDLDVIDLRAPDLYLETLGISDEEKTELVKQLSEETLIDPVVSTLIGATCGNAYKHLIADRRLAEYPIPSIALNPSGAGNTLLDVGCSWGRWSIAAARKGFSAVGIDPSLGAIMAARRIAKQLNLDIKYVVADARFLPFRSEHFDCVHSYSVLQHFSKENARTAISDIGRVLKRGGLARIQMANKWGLRSRQQQALRALRKPRSFDVRYWTIPELKSVFSDSIGKVRITADCFFGLGWQWSDFRYMTGSRKPALVVSEVLRRLSDVFPPVRMMADSLFCIAVKGRSS
jgi:2-polyprenyl-3-methyl-5-hydroxy-6-metoxy-1,4-benzoquinol methylase/uncharacterized protein YbaR (Trm112 family)